MVSEFVRTARHDFDSGWRALSLYSERFRVLGCVRCFLSNSVCLILRTEKWAELAAGMLVGDKERSPSMARVDHTQAAIRSGLKQIKARGQVHGTSLINLTGQVLHVAAFPSLDVMGRRILVALALQEGANVLSQSNS
jgi:hypothetical protein